MKLIDKFKNLMDSLSDDDYLAHEGVSILDGAPGRGSGRYPLGSGINPNQHRNPDLLDRYEKLKKKGMSLPDIAKELKIYSMDPYGNVRPSSKALRVQLQLARHAERIHKADQCVELTKKGYNPTQIAKMLGFPSESSVRNYLNMDRNQRAMLSMTTAELLKEMVDSYKTKDHPGMVDVGRTVERQLSLSLDQKLSHEKLEEALLILEQYGYKTYGGGIKRVTNLDQQTNQKVLCTPDAKHSDVYDFSNVHSVFEYNKGIIEDPVTGDDKIVPAFRYPASMNSNRIQVRYAEDGGKDLEGTVELRRGVPDLDLGKSAYSQVRILVDGTHYIKGMAVYGNDEDFLPGKDIIINSNKKRGTKLAATKAEVNNGAEQVLKTIKNDPDNPFGSAIKMGIGERGGQSEYIDPKTGEKKLSLINKRSDEGDWDEWGKELPSQFLAKQPKELIKRQLNLALADKKTEYEDIMALNNPTVKKKLLEEFANKCDSAAVHLKAAPLPNERYQVILPVQSLKDTECYAPNYKNGDRLALVRYPHQGIFEIPIVTVNNRNKEGQNKITNKAKDAIGINIKVAEQLSGADFDGDTVMVIPLRDGLKISSKPQLNGLKDFDPKEAYKYHEKKEIDGEVHYYRYGIEFTPMTHENTQREMGKTTNLLTDMTLKGASESDIVKAVKHAQVVIDAEKHGLDWKSSEKDNDIAALKKKYQKHTDDDGSGGASTLITKAKSPVHVPKREGSPRINQKGKEWYDPTLPEGALVYKTARESKLYYDKYDPKKDTWTREMRTTKTTKMAEARDAKELSSGYIQEELYGDYANSLKDLANKARLSMVNAGKLEWNRTATRVYAAEVERLDSALAMAELNVDKERKAQREANVVVNEKIKLWKDDGKSYKEYKEDITKEGQRALTAARAKYGARAIKITPTPREWEAIQAGAISESKLKKILDKSDMDVIRKYATPKNSEITLPKHKQNLIRLRSKAGYTNEEIAESLGISLSTVYKYL